MDFKICSHIDMRIKNSIAQNVEQISRPFALLGSKSAAVVNVMQLNIFSLIALYSFRLLGVLPGASCFR
jgi:hypothetical protein